MLPVLLTMMAACSIPSVDMPFDLDADGLMDAQEESLGTDPLVADSDGDGTSDGDELDANTDPIDPEDHPYAGGWPIDACRYDIESTGNSEGKIAENFEETDQFGETVSIHDFCGKAILLVSGSFT